MRNHVNNINVKYEYDDYLIQGKMVVAKATFPDQMKISALPEIARQEIRETLAKQIAHFILENDMLEFVHNKDPLTFYDTVAARCFIVPNNEVKVIRTLKR